MNFQSHRIVLLFLFTAALAACGGGGGGGGDDGQESTSSSTGSGWIELDQNPIISSGSVTETSHINFSGRAFISKNWGGCCTGSAIDTGVAVSWRNESTGENGSASQGVTYCWLVQQYVCDHNWNAIVPLALGKNRIRIKAADPSRNSAWEWVSVERRDTVAPTIDRVSPSPSASNVAVNIGIKIYFSEAVDAGSVTSSSVWLEDSVGAPVAAQNLVSGNLVTLIPRSDLQFSATYKVNVAATIRDIVGLSLSTPFSWQFETSAAPDTTAPGVVSTFPVDGAECVDTDSSLSVTFDEAMDATTIDGHSFILKEDLGSALSGTISYVDPTATKTFSQGFKLSTSYTARVTSEASDLAGNGLASDYEWHFTTATEQGSWRNISTLDQPEWRSAHTAVWTGSEMIVWGGAQNVKRLDSGGRYDPVTDSWQPTSVVGAPSSRYGHKAVWTGNEMIVWGNGVVAAIPDLTGDGGRYDPVTDSWTAVSRDEAPLNRKNFSMTWTGNEVIVWGGLDWAGRKLGNGGRYDPLTDSWTTMSTIGAPLARYDHTAVWTGNELIIWGGFGTSGELGDGARYDPATDTWMPISMLDAPGARRDHTAIWTGTEMIVWGGNRGTDNLAAGGRYSPTDDRWQPVASQCEPQARSGHLAVWTGDRMLVWGNWNENSGGLYDPVSNSWLATPFFGARSKFGSRTAVWTGEEMIIWCGCNYPDGRYDP